MKTELKDFLLSILAISLLLVITILIIYPLNAFLSKWFDRFLPLIDILMFLSIYGAATVLYLRILSSLFPLREGIYPMEHRQFTLWKHQSVVGEFGKIALKIFFPMFLKPIFFKLFGARIGKYVVAVGAIADPLFTRIEDFAVLGHDTVVTSHAIIFNRFYLKAVIIGKGATIGINSVIMPGVHVGENSIIAPGAVVSMDTKIPPDEFWGGVPAKKIKDLEKDLQELSSKAR